MAWYHRARCAAIDAGRVRGPELQTRDGRRFAAGDQILALAPNPRLGLVTSQRLDVVAVDEAARTITARTAEGTTVELAGEDVAPDQIDLAYATTIHRAQGATVDTCHVWADGLSNQLAYVAMSRARLRTTAYTVADDLEQAVEDLTSDWARQDQQRWIIDDRPTPRDRMRAPLRASEKLRRARLQAEADALRGLLRATDPGHRIRLEIDRHRLHSEREDLLAGTGRWASSPAGAAARRLDQARRAIDESRWAAEDPRASRRGRRAAASRLAALTGERDGALAAWDLHGAPIAEELASEIDLLDAQPTSQIPTRPSSLTTPSSDASSTWSASSILHRPSGGQAQRSNGDPRSRRPEGRAPNDGACDCSRLPPQRIGTSVRRQPLKCLRCAEV
jgi:hypothetical protein